MAGSGLGLSCLHQREGGGWREWRQYGHNLDLRDSHKCIQKQVWGSRFVQGRVVGGLVRPRLIEACINVCYDSAHPTFTTICVHTDVSQI